MKVICHENTPRRLRGLFKKCKYKFHVLAKERNINVSYVYKLIVSGIEPTDRTEKGQQARLKLFLPARKKIIRVKSNSSKKVKEDFIKIWDHLPTDERHQVIKEYLKWKENKK